MHSEQPVEAAEQRNVREWQQRAMQCRRLAAGIGDQRTADTLKQMANEYEERVRSAETPH